MRGAGWPFWNDILCLHVEISQSYAFRNLSGCCMSEHSNLAAAYHSHSSALTNVPYLYTYIILPI